MDGIRGNQPGMLIVSHSMGQTLIRVLNTAGVSWNSASKDDCQCRQRHRNGNFQLKLCRLHRAYIARLLKSAGLTVTPRAPKAKRKRRNTGDLYKAGLVVGGGLPSLGKRR